jgi:membrane associated rhomboid family serine protease
MSGLSPGKIILIGFVLVLLGVILPFLMVIHVLPSTFFLNFFSFAASVFGLMLGMYGAATYVRNQRRKR